VAKDTAARLGVRLVHADTPGANGGAGVPTGVGPVPSYSAWESGRAASPRGDRGPTPPRQADAGPDAIEPWPSGSLMEEDVVRAWRREFPILQRKIHVANCSQSAQSVRVRRAIERYLDNWLTVGMDWDLWVAEVQRAKAEFARLINAEPEDIGVAMSVSDAISSVASALDFTKRRKVVATEVEFPTVGHVWLAHQKYGQKVEFVPVTDGQVRMEDYERYVDDDTAMLSATHVYYENGFKQDIKALADLAHSRGALILVDAYQSIGTMPIDVKALDVDFLTSGNLKYLLGIPGIAFLYTRKELVPRLKPSVTGWFGQEDPFSFRVMLLDYASTARRFDTGTPPVMPAFAARAGMEIINAVGVDNIAPRIDMLSERCIEGAKARNLRIASPLDVRKKGATTAIRCDNSHKVEVALKERNIIASARGEVIRIAPHFYTLAEEIDVVLDNLVEVLREGTGK